VVEDLRRSLTSKRPLARIAEPFAFSIEPSLLEPWNPNIALTNLS
jgi:hypothetical protein